MQGAVVVVTKERCNSTVCGCVPVDMQDEARVVVRCKCMVEVCPYAPMDVHLKMLLCGEVVELRNV
eukprot:6490070-Amphidinium_carterae.1